MIGLQMIGVALILVVGLGFSAVVGTKGSAWLR